MNVDLAALHTDEDATIVLTALMEELEDAREAVLMAQRRAGGIRKLIEAVVEVFPSTEDILPDDLDSAEQPRPRGAEAVRRALADEQGRWFSVPSLVELLSERGWLPDSENPSNAVRTAAERTVEHSTVEKGKRNSDGSVVYRVGLPPPPDDGEEPF